MASEKRKLIYADTAVEMLSRLILLSEHEKDILNLYIDQCMAVDAVEVVHGRWLALEEYAEKISADPTGYTGGWRYCSECEQPTRELYGWAYCPNCGAKMDGDAADA